MKEFITRQHQQLAVESLERLIAIPSVLDERPHERKYPFGQEVYQTLTEALKIAEENGFATYIDPDGYYGYAEVGAGTELFGILCHLDVVPAGERENWRTDPFTPVIEAGEMIGRGTQDDKGPSMAALFAVKALMDADVKFNQRIRFIFGTDEETLWRCMEQYAKKEEKITSGFAPDAEFPLIYAEKGLLQADLVGPGTQKLELAGGDAYNVVPNQIAYHGPRLEEVKRALVNHGFDFDVSAPDEIIVRGRSVHAKDAVQGINAISRLAIVLSELFEIPALDFLGKVIQEDATGSTIFGRVEDEQSGQLSMNIASITINQVETKIGVDMRIPVTVDKDYLVNELKAEISQFGLSYVEVDYLAPLYVPLDSLLITNLLQTYRDLTGDMTEPLISGGATFARTMANCVAYGAMFPDTPDLMHQPNERWKLSSMFKAMQIYAEAIYRICC